MNKPAISATNLVKSFGQYGQDVALRDITFAMQKGEKVGLVGANGIGKTTLLKILAGQMQPDSGKVTVGKGLSVGYLQQEPEKGAALSGGEKTQRALRALMADDHDLLLLDEPTNSLDIPALEKLEKFVLESDKTFLIVSHDRHFLDRVVTRIFEIDEHARTLRIYDGGYSDYLEQRAARIALQWKDYEDKMDKDRQLDKAFKDKVGHIREIERTRLGIRKLHPKMHDKPDDAQLRDKEASAGRRARVMKNRLERFRDNTAEIEKPREFLPLEMDFEHPTRSGDKVFDLTGMVKQMPRAKLGPLDISIRQGERVAIVGPNGAGKTTLIRILLGSLAPDAGVRAVGASVRIGYLPQQSDLDQEAIALDEFFKHAPDIEQSDGRKTLNRSRLTADDLKKRVGDLSSGERSRLTLAAFVAQKANVLVLDEPSNHLDLEALESLEDALKRFTGTLIAVSHDRYFIDKVGFSRTINI